MSREVMANSLEITRRRALLSLTALGALGLAGLGAAACAAPAPTPAAPGASPRPEATKPAEPAKAEPTRPPQAAPTKPAAPAPAATQAPPKVAAPTPWKLALLAFKFDSSFQMMAVEKGYFKERGLDVQVTQVQSGDTILKGLLAGEFDCGDFSPAPVFPAIEKGAPLKLVGTNNPRVPHVLFGKKNINDLKDLYGRSVGVAAPGAFLHALIAGTMAKEGLDQDKVQWVNISASQDVFKAVIAGKVDAGVSSVEFEPEIPPDSDVKLILAFGPRLPDYIKQSVMVTEKTLAEKREALVGFATAFTLGHRWSVGHKDETVALAVKLTNGKADVMSLAYDRYVGNNLLDLNFYLAPSAIQYTQQIGVQQKAQETVLPNERVATWEIQQALIKAIGEAKA